MWIEHQMLSSDNRSLALNIIKSEYREYLGVNGYFNCISILRKDLYRFKSMLSSYNDNKDKKHLIQAIDQLINSLSHEINTEDEYEHLIEFVINNDYVAFSYYDFDNENKQVYDLPSVCVIRRDYKKLYFISEVYEDFKIYDEDGISDTIAYSLWIASV